MYLKEKTDIYPDGYEQLFFYAPSASLNVAMGKIVELIQKGQIRKGDIDIIAFLFEFTMASLDQLSLLFGGAENDKKTKATLDKLVKMRILNKFCMAENEKTFNDDSYVIYCIDKGGAELLKHYRNGEDYTNFKIEKVVQPTLKVWKHLLLVDFYIRLLESCPNKIMMFQVQPTVTLKKQHLVPHFGMCLLHKGEEKYFIGDIVFENDISPLASRSERFAEKAIQLEKLVCTNVYKKCFGYDTPPTLLMITDNDDTLQKVADLLSTTDIPNVTKFRLTTPERLQKNLDKKGVFMALKDDKLVSSPSKVFVDDEA